MRHSSASSSTSKHFSTLSLQLLNCYACLAILLIAVEESPLLTNYVQPAFQSSTCPPIHVRVSSPAMVDSGSSSYGCHVCSCGRSFSHFGAFSKHQTSCRSTKKRLSSALSKAREVWASRKRRRLVDGDKPDIGGTLQIDSTFQSAVHGDMPISGDQPEVSLSNSFIDCAVHRQSSRSLLCQLNRRSRTSLIYLQ